MSNPEPFGFTPTSFLIGGCPCYLNSGEMHYFRVPKADWRRRMRLFREAGGNAVATYIPWLIHEPEEGRFVLNAGDGITDVEAFFQAAAEEGLYVIARPGPYQYSELVYAGLPRWLCDSYPQLLARARDGHILNYYSASYVHPLFLEKARAWLARICPIIARNQASRGGSVILVQPDNELGGIHIWNGDYDFNPEAMGFGDPEGRYPRFLRRRYGSVEEANRLYGTAVEAFEALGPGQRPAGGWAQVRWDRDYFDFYCGTLTEYLRILMDTMEEFGVTTPFCHNSANPNMNAYFLDAARELGERLVIGSDHYYSLNQSWPQNNPTPQYAVRCFVSLEQLRLMGYPPSVLEMPGGSLSDWPPITPEDARACYFLHAGLGMKGQNYYVFTGGPNPPGAGSTGEIYDYNAAVSAKGEVRPLYDTLKEYGRFWQEHPWLAEARGAADFHIALDWEMARAENTWRGTIDEHTQSGADTWDFLRTGVITTALCAGLSPALVDLDDESLAANTTLPLVVPCSGSMSRDRQQRLVRLLQAGGRILLTPVLPHLDERFEPCTELVRFLGSPGLAPRRAPSQSFMRVSIGGVPNVFVNGPAYLTEYLPTGAEVTGAEEVAGLPISWQMATPGGGTAAFLGLRWSHGKDTHSQMLRALLGRLGVRQRIEKSNANVIATLRETDTQAMLFLMNLWTSPMRTTCRVRFGENWHDTGEHDLPGMCVRTIEVRKA